MSRPARNILVLGLGNDILSDDAIGLQVVRRLRQSLPATQSVDLQESTEMGLALLDAICGYGAVVVVDSILTGQAPPGTIYELDPAGLQALTGRTPHFLGLPETLALGRALDLPMPDQVRVIAVEAADPFTIGTAMSEPLQRALPAVIERVCQTVRSLESAAGTPSSKWT